MTCDTLVKTDLDGRKVYKKKEPYNTLDEAILAAKKMNAKESTIHKLVGYKCNYCFKYHIGRNGKLLTDKDRKKYQTELGIGLKVLGKINLDLLQPNSKVKIVGWIDLSKIKD